MNKKLTREDRIKNFYLKFEESKMYPLLMILIVFSGVFFFPFGEIYDIFPTGPFVVGPYIMLILMFLAFAFYKKVLLYLYVIGLFLLSLILPYVAASMGSRYAYEVLLFFLPIGILLVINIFVAVFTYKYKGSLSKSVGTEEEKQ